MYSTKFFTLTIRGPRDAGVDISDERAQEIFSTAAQFVAKLLTNLFIWKTKSSCYYLDTFALRKQSRMSFAGMCYAHACDLKTKQSYCSSC